MKSELDKKKLIIKFAKKLNSTNLSPLRSGNISIRHTKNLLKYFDQVIDLDKIK